MKQICIFTSTRADWGLLRTLASAINQHPGFHLQLIVSGSHLAGKFGMTVVEIEKDGFKIDEKIDILKFKNSTEGIAQTMGLALGQYAKAYKRLNPDILLLLGDRYETFCAAAAAHVCRIPVAHLHGGETSEGALDEAFRHSITKMSFLHFASCETYRNRIIQLGENPENVFNVGSIGVENIKQTNLKNLSELEKDISFRLNKPFFLVTFHPVTLEKSGPAAQFKELLDALDQFHTHKVIITGANADAGGDIINIMAKEYASENPERCISIDSLGVVNYLSAAKLADTVVGNSSSGIIEIPSLKTPTVNIGDRQKGRIQAESVINCNTESEPIAAAINKSLNRNFRRKLSSIKNPYEKENTADKIIHTLKSVEISTQNIKKTFYDLIPTC